MTSLRPTAVLLIALAGSRTAQTSPPTILEANYTQPAAGPRIAPSQILTLIVRGVKAAEGQLAIQARTIPLPYELAGVTATLGTAEGTRLRMPVLRIDNPLCGAAGFECDVRAVTVQVPVEVEALLRASSPERPITPYIAISEAEAPLVWTRAVLAPASPHLLGNPCTHFGPVITHGDGSFVTDDRPAAPGEIIVIYALGLGRTSPGVPTGEVAPSPAPVSVDRYSVRFSVLKSTDTEIEDLDIHDVAAEFSGLVTGLVGMYQINVRIPSRIDRLTEGTPCGEGGIWIGVRAGRLNTFVSNRLTVCVAALTK